MATVTENQNVANSPTNAYPVGVFKQANGTELQAVVPVDSTGAELAGPSGIAAVVTNAGTFAVQDTQVITDNTAFIDGTSKVFVSGHILDETAGTALTENDAAASRIDSKRAQVMVIEDTTTRGRRVTVTAANALKVDGSAATQPVTGSVTVFQSDPQQLLACVQSQLPFDTTQGFYNEYPILIGGLGVSSPSTDIPQVSTRGNKTNLATSMNGEVFIQTDPNNIPIVNAQVINLVDVSGSTVTVTGTVTVALNKGATSTQTSVAGSASSVTLLAASSSRVRYTIFNDSTAILYVRESASAASTTSFTYKLYPEGSVSVDDYTGAITGIWASATGNARISQVT